MPVFDGKTEFIKSGLRRLRDAEELLRPPDLAPHEHGADTRHLRGAMYLAGYGVECMLKAYLITKNPPAVRLVDVRDQLWSRGTAAQDICSAAGHNIRYLLGLTDLEAQFGREHSRWMATCAKWRSEWRYDPTPTTRREAEELVVCARSMTSWIRGRI